MHINKKLIIETIGIVSVAASLIFVGMQLILDRRVAIAGQYQSRSELRLETVISQFENGDYIQDIARNWEANRPEWWNDEIENEFITSNEPMSAIIRRTLRWEMFAVNMDNNYYQYRQGLLEAPIWANHRQQIKNILMNDSTRRAFYVSLSTTLPSFNELLVTIVEEIDNADRNRRP